MLVTSTFSFDNNFFYAIIGYFCNLHICLLQNALEMDQSKILSMGKVLIIFLFSQSKWNSHIKTLFRTGCNQPSPKQQILDSSKLKEFADDNFEFDENGGKFS